MSRRPGISGANVLRLGCGVDASDVESSDDDITSYLKRSANALEEAASLGVDTDW